jgi:heme-degrading monooxygenase HmoA
MHARVSMLKGPPDQIDAGVEAAEANVLPALRSMSGARGIVFLGDRSSGKTMAITFWESEEAMRESREAATRLREQTAEAESAEVTSVEEFEVLLHEMR